jgi:hypothetical protein
MPGCGLQLLDQVPEQELKDRRKLGGVDIFSYGEADREVLEDGTIEKQGETIASAAVEGAVGLSDDGSSS